MLLNVHEEGEQSPMNLSTKSVTTPFLAWLICTCATNRGYPIGLFIHSGKFWMMSCYLTWELAAKGKDRAVGHGNFDPSITEPSFKHFKD